MKTIERIFLGKVKTNIKGSQSYQPERDRLSISGENLWIEKHTWDCDWYWGFGYIGNHNLHTHAGVFIKKLLWHSDAEVFTESIFNEHSFWVFKDLLKQAYALQACAEFYRLGDHCVADNTAKIVVSKEKEDAINADLKKVLDALWTLLLERSNPNKEDK